LQIKDGLTTFFLRKINERLVRSFFIFYFTWIYF
jgi:hypothetical protein